MNGHAPKDIKAEALQPVSGVVTNFPISADAGLSWGGALHLRIDIKVSGIVVAGTLSAKLQMRAPNGSFTDMVGANAIVTLGANGFFSLTQLVERAADQPNMPLQKQIRVVLSTTNAGDAITIDNVWLYQEL